MYNSANFTVVDIEANGLLDTATKVHCIVTCDPDGTIKQWHESPLLPRQGNIKDALNYLGKKSIIAGHNIIGYDFPLLKKLFNWSPTNFLDTFICSQMLYANERATHGLGEWGKVFGIEKPKQEQWEIFNADMLHRCTEDVKINKRLLDKCLNKFSEDNWDWSQSIKLEQKVYEINCEMGSEWQVDLTELDVKLDIYNKLYEKINYQLKSLKKPEVIQGKEISYLTKSGKPSVASTIYNACGDFCKIDSKEFEPSSVKQLVEYLLSVGWKPESKTPKGAPSLRDDPLIGVPLHIAAVISDFRDAIHRRGVLEGFKKKADPITGKLKMFSYTCGTNTARFRHAVIANIQPEFKDLFTVPEGYKLVGCDASQLEARIEGHYTQKYDNGLYGKYLLEMDVHQFNADAWGVTRNEAKAPFYAMAYGCGATKLASLLNVSESRAKEIIDMHYETWYGLKMLLDDIEWALQKRGFLKAGKWGKKDLDESKNPWIIGLDKRKLYVRGMHKLKNTLIQSAGSIAMKWAYCRLYDYIKENNLDARIVMFYHDEFQVIIKDDAEQIKLLTQLIERAIVESGEHFKLRIPLKGEAKVGNNWKETK